MKQRSSMKSKSAISSTIEYVNNKIKALNGLVAVSLSTLFLVNVWLMYELVAYLNRASIVGILGSTSLFLIAIFLVARGLSNAMFSAFHRYNTQLETLLTDMKQLRSIPYTDVLLEKSLDAAQGLVKADAGVLYLVENDLLVPKVITGKDGMKVSSEPIPKSAGPIGLAVERGISIIVNEVGDDHRFKSSTGKTGLPLETRSIMSLPLKVRNKTVGAFALINKKDGKDFTSEDEHLLEFLAAQVAAGLEHSRFYEEKNNYEIHFTNVLIEAIENINEKRGHAKRIAKYALMMADDLGFGYEDKRRLYRAALLHDIGFIRLNPKYISSPEQYQQHVGLGYDMLNPIDLYSDIAPFVLHHHERYDGHGYPQGLKGRAIPLESRILFVAEAFDAMVSKLSYKNAGTVTHATYAPSTVRIKEAIVELRRNAGTQFDPNVVEVFIKNVASEDFNELADEVCQTKA